MPTKKAPKLTKNNPEATFQKKFVSWLRQQGCVCFKMTPGTGIPTGTPDYLCLKDGFWFMVEFKASKTSKFRPGQKEALEKYNAMSYAVAVYPENEAEIKADLSQML